MMMDALRGDCWIREDKKDMYALICIFIYASLYEETEV